ncbi:hypothetical protein KUCAC02_004923, partial [Chaenocephalus aceratus]
KQEKRLAPDRVGGKPQMFSSVSAGLRPVALHFTKWQICSVMNEFITVRRRREEA